MHCVRDEHSSINMNLHYLDNGTVMLNFIYHKELFFLPLGFALKVTLVTVYVHIARLKSDRSDLGSFAVMDVNH